MMQKLGIFLSKNRRLLPLSAAIVLFSIAYAIGAAYLPGMRDSQVFLNLFNQTPLSPEASTFRWVVLWR
jgi:hypothetical protein